MAEQTAGLTSFIHLVETIADNKYVLGDRLVEVGVSGPNLEATLAAIAMAQGELGHARLLYNWSADLKGVKKADVKDQSGKALPNAVKVNNWITLIASLYATNAAIDLVLKAVSESEHAKVASRVQKLINEQKEHIIYARGWAKQFLNDKGAVPAKFKEALNEAIPEAGEWLKSVEAQTEIVEEGYMSKTVSLYEAFKAEVEQLTTPALVSTN